MKRKLALECLRGMYALGDVEIINKLWKQCKSSFEIQPYNVIPIESLSLEENELGRGTFGCVKKGTWINAAGEKITVAVKIIQENTLVFDLGDLRSEVPYFYFFPNLHHFIILLLYYYYFIFLFSPIIFFQFLEKFSLCFLIK